jgi:hypothetical protein
LGRIRSGVAGGVRGVGGVHSRIVLRVSEGRVLRVIGRSVLHVVWRVLRISWGRVSGRVLSGRRGGRVLRGRGRVLSGRGGVLSIRGVLIISRLRVLGRVLRGGRGVGRIRVCRGRLLRVSGL